MRGLLLTIAILSGSLPLDLGQTINPQNYSMVRHHATIGEINETNMFVLDYTMPDQDVTLYFYFYPLEPLNRFSFTEEEPKATLPIITHRPFTISDVRISEQHDDFWFVNGEILVIATRYTSYRQMEHLLGELGGEIVGFIQVPNMFQVYFANVTEDDLFALRDLLNTHEYIVTAALNTIEINRGFSVDPWGLGASTDNWGRVFPPPIAIEGERYVIPNDLFWQNDWHDFNNRNVGGRNWGVEVINAPELWWYFENYRQRFTEYINVGVIDNFFEDHEDLDIEVVNDNYFFGLFEMRNHGVFVGGIIGATPNNNRGIAGITWNANMFGYAMDSSDAQSSVGLLNSVMDYTSAKASLFANNVRVINVSRGRSIIEIPQGYELQFDISNHEILLNEREIMTGFLGAYLDSGHDFLIVQSGGNRSSGNHITGTGWVDTRYGGIYRNIIEPRVRDRIIIVGSMTAEHHTSFPIATGVAPWFTSQLAVDDNINFIFAPGHSIFSLSVNNGGTVENGTSAAAPFVTGVAAKVWSANPNLTGSQVRELILNNAHPTLSLEINTERGLFTYPVLYAPAPVRAAWETVGQGYPNFTHATIMGGIQVFQYGFPMPIQVDLDIDLSIYRLSDLELVATTTAEREGWQHVFYYHLPRDVYALRFNIAGAGEIVRIVDTTVPFSYLLIDITYGLYNGLSIYIDNVRVVTEGLPFLYPQPRIDRGRIIAPAGSFANALGFHYGYMAGTDNILLTRQEEDMTTFINLPLEADDFLVVQVQLPHLSIERDGIFIDGITHQLIDDIRFLPIRSIAYALRYDVDWDYNLNRADIRTGRFASPSALARLRAAPRSQENITRHTIGSVEWR